MAKQQPPNLEPGDKVAIVCPSGYMDTIKAQKCIAELEKLELEVITGPTLGGGSNYFSGTDEERAKDLQKALDDKSINAIICGRGGYGMSRIIDSLNFKKFNTNPKWIVGFSDITLLHTHINRNTKFASIHGPMAGAFENYPESEYPSTIFPALMGVGLKYATDPHPFNKIGKAEGQLIGGNLTLLAHSIGTKSEPKTKGRILFIEDVGEYIYGSDRMLLQLKRAGWFDKIAGLIIGTFSDMKDTTRTFGTDIYSAISKHIEAYHFPIAFDFPVGHTERNVALKIGINHVLDVKEEKVILKEK